MNALDVKNPDRYMLQVRRGPFIAKYRPQLTARKIDLMLTRSFMDRLDACMDDASRRLLMGLSR